MAYDTLKLYYYCSYLLYAFVFVGLKVLQDI